MIKTTRNGPVPGIAVIGMGNWGSSLAHAVRQAGIPLCEAVVTSRARRSRIGQVGRVQGAVRGLSVTSLTRARLDAAILWLCVPDSAIVQVTRRLIERVEARGSAGRSASLKGQIVVHSSGALNAAVLEAAAQAGASVASVHPVMTFPTRVPVSLVGVPFGIEADQAVRRKLNAVVRRLGGEPFAVDASSKALYHAVGMLASPLLVSLVAAAQETAALAGLNPRQGRRMIEPIVQTTLKNIFARGAANSFSGPIARGDAAAIHLHLQALMPHPMVASVYRSLALYALEVLPARDRVELRRLLQRPITA